MANTGLYVSSNFFSYGSLFVLFLIFFQDRSHFADGRMTMIFSIDLDNRSDSATAETCDGLESELAVFRRFPGGDIELPLEFLEDLRPAPDVTGRAHANETGVFPPGGEAECAVECGNPDNISQAHVQLAGNLPEGFRRKIVILGLDIKEDRDQILLKSLVLIDDGLNFLLVDFHSHPSR